MRTFIIGSLFVLGEIVVMLALTCRIPTFRRRNAASVMNFFILRLRDE